MAIRGKIYHLYNRGANRGKIFSNPGNYVFLMEQFLRHLPHYEISVLAFCLMPNHYHLLIMEMLEGHKSRFIQRVFNGYTQAYNHQQRRRGTLFEGRVRKKLVESSAYLLELIRYIHLNPVRAGLVTEAADWEFSSHHEWLGRRGYGICDQALQRWLFTNSAAYEDFLLGWNLREMI